MPDFRGRLDRALDVLDGGAARRDEPQPRDRAAALPAGAPGLGLRALAAAAEGLQGAPSAVPTKSGLMVGLGETDEEILEVMRDLRAHDVDMLTIGQYLQPSKHHLPVTRYVDPDDSAMFEEEAAQDGLRERRLRPDGALAATTRTGRRRGAGSPELAEEGHGPDVEHSQAGLPQVVRARAHQEPWRAGDVPARRPHARRDDGVAGGHDRLDLRLDARRRVRRRRHRLALVAPYITILQRAEFYGERSNCPKCGAYGRLQRRCRPGMDADPGRIAEAVAPLEAAWMRVECRKCGTGWRMPD